MRVYRHHPTPQSISDVDAYERVIRAVRTIDAMPDRERRFLMAGQGSWLAKLGNVWTWHDANAQHDTVLDPLERVVVHRKTRHAPAFADPVVRDPDMPPTPRRIRDAALGVATHRRMRMHSVDQNKGTRRDQFVPAASRYVPKKEPDPPREVFRPSRKDISDAMIAGAWFAALALRAENVCEFEKSRDAYRRGKSKTTWVDDQRIVAMHARGASLKTIGGSLRGGKLNAEQVEVRIRQIARSLSEIANGRSRPHDQGNGSDRRKSPRADMEARGSEA